MSVNSVDPITGELSRADGIPLDALPAATDTPVDADLVAVTENGSWVKKTFSKIWDYIKGKINANEIAPTKITNTTNFNFTSNDTTDANATSWTSVTKVDSATDISIATFFQRITQMFKNVRYLYNRLNTIGTVYEVVVTPTNVAQTSSYTFNAASLTIPAGTYVISCTGRFGDGKHCGSRAFLTIGGIQCCVGAESLGLSANGFSASAIATYNTQTTIYATFFFENSVNANVLGHIKFSAVRVK